MKTRNPITAKILSFIGTLALSLALTGCYTTSISNPTNPSGSGTGSWLSGHRGGNSLYKGELHDYDVLGIPGGGEITEQRIQAALGKSGNGRVKLDSGESILLVQSGAPQPDAALSTAMSGSYQVIPFSGIPHSGTIRHRKGDDGGQMARRLRLAAANAGARHAVVVFGTLESATGKLGSKALSWAPLVGQLLPDEQQATRINLRAILLETATGKWRAVHSESVVRKQISSRLTRSATWDRAVEELKKEAYPNLVAAIRQ